MVVFAQAQDTERVPAIFTSEPAGTIPQQPIGPPAVQAALDLFAVITPAGTLTTNNDQKPTFGSSTFQGLQNERSSGGFLWFEDFHVVPRAFDFGQLLSDQSSPIEVFNAHRREPPVNQWLTFVNNAGAGVSLGGLPSLPVDVDPMSKIGTLTVDVSTSGDPFVDSDLVFTFTGGLSISVPIELQRIVLFGLEPEVEFTETLGFLTDVWTSKDGSEQRASLRKAPRQSWDYDYIVQEGLEAQTLENLLFDFQSLTFGVPVFFEDSTTTVGITAGDSTITVDATAFRDYREGGSAVILTDQGTFDVLTIDAGGITATTLTFTSPTINSYNVGTKVFPLAPSTTKSRIGGARWPVGLRRWSINWLASDNDVDLGDLSAFSDYKGKLLLDNGNSILGSTTPHNFDQRMIVIDGGTGLRNQTSTWDRHKRNHIITLRASGREAVFNMRRMIHAIRGRAISFYIPTDSADLVVVADLLSAGNTMDVTNVGFAQFVRQRQAKADLRVNFVDGSTPLLRAITASSSPSATVDQLTVDVNWPSLIAFGDISSVDYLEKVRFNTDEIKIEYDRSGHRARMVAPIRTVFE